MNLRVSQMREGEHILPYDDENSFSSLLQTLLEKRGIATPEEAKLFLNPDYDHGTHDPFLLKDMDRAVARILHAISGNQKIIIYSDYDTDGIPGGTLLHDFFKKISYRNFENYIPHRNNEGYGLNNEALTLCVKNGASLVITVDCGITDNKEVDYANDMGLNVIITDHHLPGKELPKAHAVVNPNRTDDTYPFKGLCGAGVAFKLVQALVAEGRKKGLFDLREGWEKWLLDLVAIATISDMVPLVGENRIFAYWGLRVLRRSRRVGLTRLLGRSGVDQRYLTEEDIGFVIGPRINVASRIDVPAKAFQLLATEDLGVAGLLVDELNLLNERRKGLVASVIKEAKQRIARQEIREVIVLGNLNWHPGILGLAANHLMREHKRPVFLWGEGGGNSIKGSCRSDGSVNIVELMSKIEGVWENYGGHEYSGGFTVTRRSLHVLEERLVSAYGRAEKQKEKEEVHDHDGVFTSEDITEETYRVVESLAPFGAGNKRPLFLFENMEIKEAKKFGKKMDHLMLMLKTASGTSIQAIQFFEGSAIDERELRAEKRVSFSAHLEQHVFRGRKSLRLRIVEFKTYVA